jgi:uncharacterized protein (DUF2141 family)
MRTGPAIACSLFAAAWAQSAAAAQVTITITGIRDSRGVVRVAVCPRADFLHPYCPYVAQAPSAAGILRVTIDGVPPGIYAAQAYQDANDNGILDRNWLGLPKEGMGFSHDAPIHFGPPAFNAAAFTLGAANAALSFRLRYFIKP